jgi:transposase-like protein
MPLSAALLEVPLTLACPFCGHERVGNGIWFRSITHFRCRGCRREVPVSYELKIALFAKYAHLDVDRG